MCIHVCLFIPIASSQSILLCACASNKANHHIYINYHALHIVLVHTYAHMYHTAPYFMSLHEQQTATYIFIKLLWCIFYARTHVSYFILYASSWTTYYHTAPVSHCSINVHMCLFMNYTLYYHTASVHTQCTLLHTFIHAHYVNYIQHIASEDIKIIVLGWTECQLKYIST